MQTTTSNKPSGKYLYLAIFTSGMVTLAVELSASRLLGNVFGSSNIVWANVIGLILLYLTAGYFIGGRWADRSPYPTTFYGILLWGAFLSALIPLVARPVLVTAATAVAGAEAALAIGSFASVLVLFSIPVTLLGCASPFAVRLALADETNLSRTGKISGRINAISTLGSLLGTYLPTIIIIPELGTVRTFLLFGGLLYTVALIGLFRHQGVAALRWLWMPLVIAVLAYLVLSGPLRPPFPGATLLYEKESQYNYIQVQEDTAGNRYLYLNEGQGIHSQWSPNTYSDNHRTWSFFLTAPYFNPAPTTPVDVKSIAIVGLAGGTIARQYNAVYEGIPIDGIEIDGAILEAGARYFDLNTMMMPGLTTYAQDGRYMLNHLDKKYSLIAVDAYRPPYIPWHLTTVEFFQEVRNRLDDNGVVAINVGRTNADRRLVDAMTATLSQVFPSIHAMDVPASFNTILVATVQPTDSINLVTNLQDLPPDAPELLRDSLTWGVQQLVPTYASDTIFTDDHAPVETLVDSLVVNFLLSNDLDNLAQP
ncbi:MAG: fused MFS/spermidine synthase [Chloroflexi bacterium]|nr:fused MFS/spermidine synthase [Chloroflexota bacterium]MCC6891255.1 fused MFS/spermidine synthase [Anaerolineae bacterium]